MMALIDEQRPLKLALVFGGRSGEHEVSVVSARSVARALDSNRYVVVPMAIDHTGKWADGEVARKVLETSGDRTDHVVSFAGDHSLDSRLLDGSIDVAVPILHGPYGEDGTIQGLFEMLDLPYVGCSVTSCAVCMDKAVAKRLIVEAGLPTPSWTVVERSSWQKSGAELCTTFLGSNLPIFVKPARLGSSVGITRVTAEEALEGAVETALRYDTKVIVESGVRAREIEVAVLGFNPPRASVPGEIVPGHEFYDYEDKYVDDSCQLLAPAPLDESQAAAAKDFAIRAYRALGCDGMARVDLFLDESSGEFLFNEANTIPGFTSISMYPRLWGLSDLPYSDLLDELIRLGIERHSLKKELGARDWAPTHPQVEK